MKARANYNPEEGPLIPIENVDDQDVDTDGENIVECKYTLFAELETAICLF